MARIGIDLGGTKIAAIGQLPDGRFTAEHRLTTPKDDYAATVRAVAEAVSWAEAELSRLGGTESPATPTSVGVGIPGSIAPTTRTVQNANSTWLNGRPLKADLEAAVGQPVAIENDANCFALSEALDGAGAGARTVFGVILGTGCGGGIVIDGRLLDGPRGISGEWGHMPLPLPYDDERPGPSCWCGRTGCIETWISGPALAADYQRTTGKSCDAADIAEQAAAGDTAAQIAISRHADRTARGLAAIINLIDPDVIVLGGGLSKMAHLYRDLPALIAPHLFAEDQTVSIRPPEWGDASGVRGAARLWD
jgi:fructokinase